MQVDKSLIFSLIDAALSADYTAVRRVGNAIARQFAVENDTEAAKAIQSLLRKRGVPLQASGFAEPLPRDATSRLPLVEEGSWPSTPILMNEDVGRRVEQFIEDIRNIELLAANGVSTRLGLLLSGPPGTGKSHLAGHIAAMLGRPLYVIRLDSVISSRLGETAKNIRGIFDFVPSRNAVLFLDEVDAVAKVRDDRNELGELKRVVNTVLQGLDTLGDEVVTIAATNHAHLLDPAIWRRFPYKIDMSLPDSEVRKALWRYFLYQDSSEAERNVSILSRMSDGLSGADIENISLAARRRSILSGVEINFSNVLLSTMASHAGNPQFLDGRPVDAADKKNLTRALTYQADMSAAEIAELIGVSRQMVHRYLKEELNV